jgi:hypothetical protein
MGPSYFLVAGRYVPTTTAWSRSYGSNVNCSIGFIFSFFIFSTSDANTAAAGAVESMQLALMEITKWPPFLRKLWALRPTIRVCDMGKGRLSQVEEGDDKKGGKGGEWYSTSQSTPAHLVGLRHVGEDAVDHGDEHAVFVGVARVLDNGDDVGALLGHVDQVTSRPI